MAGDGKEIRKILDLLLHNIMRDLEQMNRMTVGAIEDYLDSILRGADKLTENLFYEEKVPAIKDSWESFAVVDCMNPIRDHQSHAVGTILIKLYARQNPYGTKNSGKLFEMEKALNRIIEDADDEHYFITRMGAYADYDAVNDIFFDIVQLNLIIT